MLERYGHGGDVKSAEELFGLPADKFLDYSSNMNPWGPPKVVEDLFKQQWHKIVQYPDPAVRDLRSKLSHTYDVPEDCILVGNGAAELIDLVVRMIRPDVTAVTAPSFSEYEEAAHKVDSGIVHIPLLEKNDFELQTEHVEQALEQSNLVFLGHPNNPDGNLLPPSVMQMLQSSSKQVIIDEAFMDFIPNEDEFSMLKHAAQSESLYVVRSMTKFFAVPGIRLGFIVAHPKRIEQLKQLQVQWSVNYMAQLIGTAVLDEREYIASTRAWLQEERPWFIEQLQEIGLKVYPSETNYVLFSLPQGWTIQALQQRLGHRGILVRDASLFPGLDTSYGRLAIRLRADNMKLISILKEVLH